MNEFCPPKISNCEPFCPSGRIPPGKTTTPSKNTTKGQYPLKEEF